MEINLELLELYYPKQHGNFTISLNTDDKEGIVFQQGKYRDNKNVRILLTLDEISAILKKNDIIGENGKISKENTEDENENLIYGTISKYIAQMLNATLGEHLYPEIKCLDKHKEAYFRDSM